MTGRTPSGPRTLVLLRHGRTAHNRTGRIQGQVDVGLDELGHAAGRPRRRGGRRAGSGRAVELGPVRAATTADFVARATDLPVTHDPRLREFALGEREGLTHDEYAAAAPEEFARFRLGDFDGVAGGESTEAVAARMTAALGELLAVTPPGGTAVAVSHGAAIRTAVTALLGWPLTALAGLHGVDNCGWVVLDDQRVDPDGAGAMRLRAYNRTAPTP